MRPLIVEQGWDPYQLVCYDYPKNRPLVMLVDFLLIHIEGPLVSIVHIGPLVTLIGSRRSLIMLVDSNLSIRLNWHSNPLT